MQILRVNKYLHTISRKNDVWSTFHVTKGITKYKMEVQHAKSKRIEVYHAKSKKVSSNKNHAPVEKLTAKYC